MKKSSVVVLMIGLTIAGFVGLSVYTNGFEKIDRAEAWCNNQGGEIDFQNEVMYCDLPEKDVLSSDIVNQNYPENTSQLPHTDMETYGPTPLLDPFGFGIYAILIGVLALGGGLLIGTIARYRE